MITLENLEAQRTLITMAGEIGNRWEWEMLLTEYERDCRSVGIDPDTWEGIRE